MAGDAPGWAGTLSVWLVSISQDLVSEHARLTKCVFVSLTQNDPMSVVMTQNDPMSVVMTQNDPTVVKKK